MTELREFTSPTKERPLNESVASMQQTFTVCFAHTICHSDNTDMNLPCSQGISSSESRHKQMVWIPGGPKGRITNLKDCNVKTGKWRLHHKSKDNVKKGTQQRKGCSEALGGTGTAGSDGQHLARVASRAWPRWVVTEADATMKVSYQTTRPLLALCLHSERGRKPLRLQRRTISSDRF